MSCEALTLDQAEAAVASLRPLGMTSADAIRAARAHRLKPIETLRQSTPFCRACSFLANHSLAVLQRTLWHPDPSLDGPLEWAYGSLCRILPQHPHAFLQHPTHPPARLMLCEAAAGGLVRVVTGRPFIGLIACSATKLDRPAPAADLYQGQLFRQAKAFVERWCHAWSILSARHWLVAPDIVLEPYDQRMPGNSEGRWRWDQMVSWEVYSLWRECDLVLLVGQDYCRWTQTGNWSRELSVSTPLRGYGIGRQKRWLKQALRTGPPKPGSADRLFQDSF